MGNEMINHRGKNIWLFFSKNSGYSSMLHVYERVFIQIDTSLNSLWPVCCQNNRLSGCASSIGTEGPGAILLPGEWTNSTGKSQRLSWRFLHLRAEWRSKNSSALLTLGQHSGKLAGLNEKYTVLVIKCTLLKPDLVGTCCCDGNFWCLSALRGGWQER